MNAALRMVAPGDLSRHWRGIVEPITDRIAELLADVEHKAPAARLTAAESVRVLAIVAGAEDVLTEAVAIVAHAAGRKGGAA